MFILGIFIGTFLGIMIMCLLFTSKEGEKDVQSKNSN